MTMTELRALMRRGEAWETPTPTLTLDERKAIRAAGFRPVWGCGVESCPDCGGFSRTWHRADNELPAPSFHDACDEPPEPEPKPERRCRGCGGSLSAIAPSCSTCLEREKKRAQRRARG